MKILLVEDNVLNQKIVVFHLRKYNYEIVAVTNWRDAMEQIKNNKPDLILMDIMLPEKNGYEITGDIREYEKNSGFEKGIPIVALTANTLDNDLQKCLDAGMNDYLSKPFSSEDLQAMIAKYLI